MELNQLEQLVAVAGCGTLSGAAEKLHISQPALTRSMQRLEEDLQLDLFDRHKNKIALNANGRLAVEYAHRVLNQTQDMVARLRAFDRSQHTLLLGFCAPMPQQELISIAGVLYPELTIASELRGTTELEQGLRDGTYQGVILPYAVEEEEFLCVLYGSEKLFLSLPPAHPLAKYKTLHFKDIDGENVLLYAQIGFWNDMCKQEMPHAHFLTQQDRYSFIELIRSSALPCFVTDITMRQYTEPNNRVVLPILDDAASVTYYFVCKKSAGKQLARLLQRVGALE